MSKTGLPGHTSVMASYGHPMTLTVWVYIWLTENTKKRTNNKDKIRQNKQNITKHCWFQPVSTLPRHCDKHARLCKHRGCVKQFRKASWHRSFIKNFKIQQSTNIQHAQHGIPCRDSMARPMVSEVGTGRCACMAGRPVTCASIKTSME